MKRFFILINLIAMAALPPTVRALDWSMALELSIPDTSLPRGAVQSRLVLGVAPSATDAFDHQWDTVALWSSPLKATFPHSEYPNDLPETQWLWQDIRGNSESSHTWNIEVASDRFGTNTTINWTFTTSMAQCQHPMVTLTDITHNVSNPISGNGSYTFPNGANPTQLVVQFTQGVAALPPTAPANLWSPRQGKESILLSWSSSNEPTLLGYHLFRHNSGQTTYTQITSQPVTSLSFMDKNLLTGETYFYKALAVNTDGCTSGDSNEISVTLN
jgi:hypothetical protein